MCVRATSGKRRRRRLDGRSATGRDPFGRIGGFDPALFLFDAHPGGGPGSAHLRAHAELIGAPGAIERCPCAKLPGLRGSDEDSSIRKRTALDILIALELREATPIPLRVVGARSPFGPG
jgi:hypothetical protein